MIFSSVEFLLYFLPLFLLLYALTPKRLQNVTLLSGSLIFYALGEPRYLIILMLSVLINYFLGRRLARASGMNGSEEDKIKLNKRRKNVFILALVFNLGLLTFFKYGAGKADLPVGISFYTFQILSWLIDGYRGEQKREVSFLTFASYVTMFPQLLSGPLVPYGELEKSLKSREFTAGNLQEGLKIFALGLTGKVLLADRIGLLWQEVQVTGFESISVPLAWMGALSYSLKIYFDFSGYSLMAMGVGRMLGFELPENFNLPYMATSVREFYRRWHITLGRWFCKYVYIPLGGNRRGELRTVCNLLAVWFLTSLWHGSTANFLIWGMFLWLAIVIERQLEALGISGHLKKGPGRFLCHLYIWAFIPITWVCFAVTDVEQLQIYMGRMFGVLPGIQVSAQDWIRALKDYGMLFLGCAIACTSLPRRLFEKLKDTLIGGIILAALFWFCIWRLQREGLNPFMYLQF